MKLIRMNMMLFVTVLALPLAAMGEEGDVSNAAAATGEVVDNIVVVGEKSLSELRRDVFDAEEEFYSIYNRLNDDNEYDVRCFYEKATGTHIDNHVCRARFVSKAFSAHAARNRNDMSRVANQDSNPAFAAKTATYQEKLETLIAANPELQDALIRYNTLRAEFTAKREDNGN